MKGPFNTDDIKAESGFQLGVGHVSLLHSHCHGTDEPLVLWRFASESVGHVCAHCHFSLPSLLLPLTGLNHLEHVRLTLRPHLGNWHVPLACLFLTLLLHHVGQHLGPVMAFPLNQVSWHSSFRRLVIIFLLGVLLIVNSQRLLHLNLLKPSLPIHQLGLQPNGLPGLLTELVGSTSLLLPLPLLIIQPAPVKLDVPLNMFVLRHLVFKWYLKLILIQIESGSSSSSSPHSP